MARNQVENPPGHAHTAPAGEIRHESRATLRWFTAVIAIACALPILGGVIGSLSVEGGGRQYVFIFGGIIAVLIALFALILWRVISSRTPLQH